MIWVSSPLLFLHDYNHGNHTLAGVMNLSLTPEIEQRIADQLNPGHDQSTHEVILAALELLDQRQQ